MAGKAATNVRRAWRHLVVPCVLVVLVGVLASLQYRWVGQIADAERQRMQASAQARASQFADEIDREITTLFFSFSQLAAPPGDAAPHLPGPPADGNYASAFAEEYARWAGTSTHPKLVRALYLCEGDAWQGPVQKLTPGVGRFESTSWPPGLAALRSSAGQPGGEGARSLAPRFDVRIPGLVLPVARFKASDLGGDATPGRIRVVNLVGVWGHLVVELDRGYIEREWLPALARRYFASADGYGYNLAVIDSASRAFLFVSDPSVARTAFDRPDVTAPLFRVRTDQIERFVMGRATSGETKGAPGNRIFQLSISAIREHSTTAAAARTGGGAGQWQLVLTHRAGSLEAAIAQSRGRNLAVSFGILALLAVSLGLIVLSTRRAASLARQQVEFVAGVSHELRTPLSVICSAAENLADGVVVEPAQVRRYGGLIAEEGRRLAEMVEQVMAFAGFHAGRDVEERQPMAVGEVVDRALAAVARSLERHHVAVEKTLAPDLPQVSVNPRAIERAVQNLIDNAIKYGGESRWLGVGARFDADAGAVAITVADRGVGISPEEQRRIFEPFFRGRDVAASSIHGSGLGLSLVSRIVKAHGGRLTVKSAPGEGSVFTIHLPALRPLSAGASAPGIEERAG